MIPSVPNYFDNSGTPIICYKYNKPIRSAIFNFDKISIINIDSNTSGDCQLSTYVYPPAEQVITGNLNAIFDTRACNTFSLQALNFRFSLLLISVNAEERLLLH